MNEETQLAPQELHRKATDVAGVCKEIVVKTAMQISGRKYVRVEGWQSIATAHGCIASSRDVEETESGVRAIGEVRRIADGVVISTSEGFVGKDEPTWYGGTTANNRTLPKRPDYAIRAMAQTRAISRACRAAFAHVVVLMDSGLSTTPAEEVPDGGFDHDRSEPDNPPPAAQRAEPRNVTPPKATGEGSGHWRDVKIHFGKKQGETLGHLADTGQLDWWLDKWQPKEYRGEIPPEAILLRKALDAAMADLRNNLQPERSDPDTGADQDDVNF